MLKPPLLPLLGFVGVLVANTGDVTSTLTDAKQFNDLRAAVCPKQPSAKRTTVSGNSSTLMWRVDSGAEHSGVAGGGAHSAAAEHNCRHAVVPNILRRLCA